MIAKSIRSGNIDFLKENTFLSSTEIFISLLILTQSDTWRALESTWSINHMPFFNYYHWNEIDLCYLATLLDKGRQKCLKNANTALSPKKVVRKFDDWFHCLCIINNAKRISDPISKFLHSSSIVRASWIIWYWLMCKN